MIKKKEIERIAFFARLHLDDEEQKRMPEEIDSILQYIQRLRDVDINEIEPLFHFPELKNVVREDIAKTVDRETQKQMMAMGKDKDDYLKVESIL